MNERQYLLTIKSETDAEEIDILGSIVGAFGIGTPPIETIKLELLIDGKFEKAHTYEEYRDY